MSELVEFSRLSNSLVLSSDHFPVKLCQSGGINQVPNVWLDGARQHPKYVYKNNTSSTSSKINQLRPSVKLERVLKGKKVLFLGKFNAKSASDIGRVNEP